MHHHPARPLSLIAGLLAITLVSACGDALGPEDVAGTFVLANAPAVVGSDPTERVVADTLFIEADGTGRRVTWIEPTSLSLGEVTQTVRNTPFTYQLRERSIGFEWQCPPGQVCAAVLRVDWYDLSLDARKITARDESAATYLRSE